MNIFLYCLLIAPWLFMLVWFMIPFYTKKGERRAAEQQAAVLLHEILTDSEYEHLLSLGYVEFSSPTYVQRVYRVPWRGGLIQVRENNRMVMQLCLQSVERLPRSDVVALHKLMIEAEEETYLQTANQFSTGHGRAR